jgi:hypothetical protein
VIHPPLVFPVFTYVIWQVQHSVYLISGCEMEQLVLKNVNNCLNANIYSYFEASSGKSYNLYLNVVHFFNTSVN